MFFFFSRPLILYFDALRVKEHFTFVVIVFHSLALTSSLIISYSTRCLSVHLFVFLCLR